MDSLGVTSKLAVKSSDAEFVEKLMFDPSFCWKRTERGFETTLSTGGQTYPIIAKTDPVPGVQVVAAKVEATPPVLADNQYGMEPGYVELLLNRLRYAAEKAPDPEKGFDMSLAPQAGREQRLFRAYKVRVATEAAAKLVRMTQSSPAREGGQSVLSKKKRPAFGNVR